MTTRANYKTQSLELLKKHVQFNNRVKEGQEKVRGLVGIRASQLNRCAFCLDTACLRNTSALLPDRLLCKSYRPTSMSEDSPIKP